MSFSSVRALLDACKAEGRPLYEVILRSDLAESGLTEAESRAAMRRLWGVMVKTSENYRGSDRSASGFAGGDAAKVEAAAAAGALYSGGYYAQVIAEALKTAECNACMKRIVAAPTAGSCGVLPAVLLPLWRAGAADEEAVCRALYVAAGFGQIVAARATLAGAEGGCQAEVGAASGMAAAALTDLKGGTAEACAEAFAMALANLEGLVCDPRRGPCRAALHQAQCRRGRQCGVRRRYGAGRRGRPYPGRRGHRRHGGGRCGDELRFARDRHRRSGRYADRAGHPGYRYHDPGRRPRRGRNLNPNQVQKGAATMEKEKKNNSRTILKRALTVAIAVLCVFGIKTLMGTRTMMYLYARDIDHIDVTVTPPGVTMTRSGRRFGRRRQPSEQGRHPRPEGASDGPDDQPDHLQPG